MGGRTLGLVDDFARATLTIEVGRSKPGERVARELQGMGKARGVPRAIILDYGREFTSCVPDQWAHRWQVEPRFVQPGKPSLLKVRA